MPIITKPDFGQKMLKISKLTDYATVIMSYLALESDKIHSATQIAKQVHLNVPTVSKLLKILCEAKLVKSYRGTGGGYQLTKPSAEITIAEVLSAIEGKLAMTECCSPHSICALDTLCGIKDNWKIINNIILQALGQITLQDMTGKLTGHPLALRGIPIRVAG